MCCGIQPSMNLALVMAVKSLVMLVWLFITEWNKPQESLDEQGGGYTPTYEPLRLPAPEDTTRLPD